MPILNWLNKDKATQTAAACAYRLLTEVPDLSCGDKDSGNLIVQGDNLEALKALIPHYAGQVKCIYIDPPYNIGSAFEHYDDNLEHSLWLNLIYPRLELLWSFLSEEGSIWISCDDRESHYLKVICDEIFGRDKFIASNIWQKRYSRENREAIGDVHEYILTYAMKPEAFKNTRNTIKLEEKQLKLYKNPDNDPNGPWQSVSLTAQGYRPNQMYEIIAPSGKHHRPPEGSCWKVIENNFKKELSEGRIYFGKNGLGVPRRKNYLKDAKGLVPWTWWNHEEVGHTDESKKEIHSIFGKKDAFDTPKPERLIERVLHIATNPNDLILDSFLGSGTTAAVAHKMGRRYIGVEIGEHAVTHCVPRLKAVIDGEQGGISKALNWQGGGGFRFCRLGDTVFDRYGGISPAICFAQLAAHIWYLETKQPLDGTADNPLLGEDGEHVYYLLYNGILGDRRPNGGNVLTNKILPELPDFDRYRQQDKQIIIYGESCRLGDVRLQALNVTFKQIPYDVGGR